MIIDFISITLGAAWGLINLFFIKQLMETILLPVQNKALKILAFTFIKFPLLYLAGYGLLNMNTISPWDLVIGFTLILLGTLIYWFYQNMKQLKKV